MVSPRYSDGYSLAKSSMARRPESLKPDVVSVRRVPQTLDRMTDRTLIAHQRGPRTE